MHQGPDVIQGLSSVQDAGKQEPEQQKDEPLLRSKPARNGILDAWAAQYHLPAEEGDAAAPQIKARYSPPSSDVWGVLICLTVIGIWAATFHHAIFRVRLPTSLADVHLLPTAIWPAKMSAAQQGLAATCSSTFDPAAQLVTNTTLNASTSMDSSQQCQAPQAAAPYGGSSSLLEIIATFLVLEFMYTGLFITTHDAMHGTIAMRNRKLNDFLGQLAITCYAWFDYNMLHKKHWEHHNHTGVVGEDPDFHQGNPSVLAWFANFMTAYMSIWQMVKIAWWAAALQLLGAPMMNIAFYMAGAGILSAVRLFYYGTYVPHHPEPGPDAATKSMPWSVSRSSRAPRLISFLTCYHFDLHWEHHRWPYAPWWQLPKCREIASTAHA